jgi:hypothetical protein
MEPDIAEDISSGLGKKPQNTDKKERGPRFSR